MSTEIEYDLYIKEIFGSCVCVDKYSKHFM